MIDFNVTIYECWYGDEFVGFIDHTEMCRLSEWNVSYEFFFTEGYGP